jgi:hypothetical protein
MRRPLSLVASALASVAITAGVASCGGSDASSTASAAPAGTTSPAASSPASSTPATTGKTPGVDESPSPGTTAPGTTLKLGQPAVLDYKDSSSGKSGIITLTVKSITKASIGDFKNMDLDAKDKTSTPYYIQMSVKNTGKTDLSGADPQTIVDGLDDRGQEQSALIVIGTFDSCNGDTTPKTFGPGASYNACEPYLVPGGGSLKGAEWTVYDPVTNKLNVDWK